MGFEPRMHSGHMEIMNEGRTLTERIPTLSFMFEGYFELRRREAKATMPVAIVIIEMASGTGCELKFKTPMPECKGRRGHRQ